MLTIPGYEHATSSTSRAAATTTLAVATTLLGAAATSLAAATTSLAIPATSLAGTWSRRPPATDMARPTHEERRS